MVCLGNICRSPLAEGILKNKLNEDLFFIDSAGTGGYHIGNKPDHRSIAVAKKYGIDISQQRCRKFKIEDFTIFDLIYVMDQSNFNNIVHLTKEKSHIDKVKLLLKEADLNTTEVPDPYYNDNGFEHVFHLIDDACEIIAKKLSAK
tara:strand:- start:517 stop:954 length:438 start_codon:yes stop_codon:yes gene_type:complete